MTHSFNSSTDECFVSKPTELTARKLPTRGEYYKLSVKSNIDVYQYYITHIIFGPN